MSNEDSHSSQDYNERLSESISVSLSAVETPSQKSTMTFEDGLTSHASEAKPKLPRQRKVAVLTSGGDSAGMNAAGEFVLDMTC